MFKPSTHSQSNRYILCVVPTGTNQLFKAMFTDSLITSPVNHKQQSYSPLLFYHSSEPFLSTKAIDDSWLTDCSCQRLTIPCRSHVPRLHHGLCHHPWNVAPVSPGQKVRGLLWVLGTRGPLGPQMVRNGLSWFIPCWFVMIVASSG